MIDKPLYRIAAAGLDPRDARLIEIVFRHSQYNRYEFQLVSADSFDAVDILIVNTVEPEGLRALARMRTLGREVPVVAAVPRGSPSSAKHAISIDRLTLQLLPILNRVVELELEDQDTRPMLGAEGRETLPAQDLVETAAAAAGFQPTRPSGSATPVTPDAHRAPSESPRTLAAAASTPDAARPRSASPGPGMPGANLVGAAAVERALPPRRAPASLTASAAVPAGPQAPARETPPAFARRAEPPARETDHRPRVAAEPPLPDEMAPVPGSRIRVLVVDDSPTVRKQLSIAFERMGAECDTADSAVGGLTRMQDVRYDLVLVDVVMPEIDGYRLTREIRRRHRGIPVIILTSRSSPFDLARGALAGCSSYLVKPVTLRRLEAAVVKVLRKTLAIDDLSGLLRPVSLYAPAASSARVVSNAGQTRGDPA